MRRCALPVEPPREVPTRTTCSIMGACVMGACTCFMPRQHSCLGVVVWLLCSRKPVRCSTVGQRPSSSVLCVPEGQPAGMYPLLLHTCIHKMTYGGSSAPSRSPQHAKGHPRPAHAQLRGGSSAHGLHGQTSSFICILIHSTTVDYSPVAKKVSSI